MDNFWITKVSNPETSTTYTCKICYYNTSKKTNYDRHLQSKKHRSKEVPRLEPNFPRLEPNFPRLEPEIPPFEPDTDTQNIGCVIKNRKHYWCDICEYSTRELFNYKRHLETEKHNRLKKEKTNYKITNKISKCEKCGKEYKFASGLSKHKKKCKKYEETKMLEDINKKIDDIAKKPFTINNTNTTNNTVNIETFLNNECMGAMDFLDFIRSITITYDDVVKMGKTGFIESYKTLITDKINDMDITMRPVHCTNKRQMYFFIKYKNIWKNDKDHKLLNTSINILKDKECEAWYNHSLTTRGKYETDKEVNERADAVNEIAKMNDDKRCKRIIKEISKTLYIDKKNLRMK
jgi:hypothetical protein